MLIKRTAMWLLAWGALVSLVGPALAQPPANSNLDYQTPTPSYENGSAPYSNDTPENNHSFLPFNPVHFEPTLDLFGPANTSGYGNGPRQHIGYFGSYERVFWSLSKPSTATVGSTTALTMGTTDPLNPGPAAGFLFGDGPTADNSFIGATGSWGNRFDVGYVDTDNYGWLVSVLDHVKQAQYSLAQSPNVLFNDPGRILHGFTPVFFPGFGLIQTDIGELPTSFLVLKMKNVLELNGVEVMRTYRTPRLHNNGHFQLLYGARWLQINDTFIVQGSGNGTEPVTINENGRFINGIAGSITTPLNVLDASTWSTRVINNIVGPQIGGRWERQRGRWVTSLEARFTAGVNFQNATQKTQLGTMTLANQTALEQNVVFGFKGAGSNSHQFSTTFSPIGEIRANTVFQLTSNVGLKVGYTGLVVGDISRASNRVDYSGPNLISILNGNTHQVFFANGVNFGFEVNR
jgi:hypothetical protein